MRERPIIMTGGSPVATREGRKTQTRRVVRFPEWFLDEYTRFGAYEIRMEIECPYGVAGDRLWVKEPWSIASRRIDRDYAVRYLADGAIRGGKFQVRAGRAADFMVRSSMFMPRWASRLLLEVTRIRVERVKEISYEDILAEGIPWPPTSGRTNQKVALATFEELWNKIHAKRGRGWKENPWVFVIDYKVIEGLAPSASHSV
jgi:hypothetical protein